MKKFSIALAIACCVSLSALKNVSAQDGPGSKMQYASYDSMQDMVDRIESLEASLASYNAGGGDAGYGKGGGCGCDCYCADACGIFAGVELVYAKPHFEDEVDDSSLESGYDYEISARYYGGVRNENGFGGRLRYWRWDHRSDGDNNFEDPFRLDVQTIDADVTQMICLGPINLNAFGGARYSRILHKDDDHDGATFEGWGPTIGVDALIPINCTNLALVGNFRYSALFGHSRFDRSSRGDDDFVNNFETQLGIQYSRCMGHGTLNLRFLVEAQTFSNGTDDPSVLLDDTGSTDEDLGFVGGVVGIEYLW